jgi:hypothetical protein
MLTMLNRGLTPYYSDNLFISANICNILIKKHTYLHQQGTTDGDL